MSTQFYRRPVGAVVLACCIGLLAFATLPVGILAGQAEPTAGEVALAGAVRERFEVDLRPDGLALTSTDAEGVTRVVTLGDGVVEVDGAPVSGAELREVFGPDADLILRVTYLGEVTRQSLFGGDPGTAVVEQAAPAEQTAAGVDAGVSEQTAGVDAGVSEQAAATALGVTAPGASEAATTAPGVFEEPAAEPGAPTLAAAEQAVAAPAAPAAEPGPPTLAVAEQVVAAPAAPDNEPASVAPRRPRTTRGEVVRVGGAVSIERDERVRGDVTVILGPLDVDGEVTGDVVVIAGSARFGPDAVVQGDVTVVAGSLQRAPSAALLGSVTQVGLGSVRGYTDSGGWWQVGLPGGGWFGSGDLVGTALRLFVLALLASGIVLVARGPVERIAQRASAEPLKAGVVGLVIQMLAVPLLVVGILGLVISIVGIPFLLFLPFIVMAFGVIMLVGFSGAVLGVGEQVRSRMGAPSAAAYASVWAGVALILLPTMAGEALGLGGGLFRGLGVLLALSGFLLEYAAWTAGLGALVLNRFSPAPTVPPAGLPAPTPPVVPPPAPVVPPVDPAATAAAAGPAVPPPVDPAATASAADPAERASAGDPAAPPSAPDTGAADTGRDER